MISLGSAMSSVQAPSAHLEVAGAVAGGAGGVVDLLDRQLDADLRPHLLHGRRDGRLVGIAGQRAACARRSRSA